MKIRPERERERESRVVSCGQTDGKTDRHNEANSRSSYFANAHEKEKLRLYYLISFLVLHQVANTITTGLDQLVLASLVYIYPLQISVLFRFD